MSAAGTQRRRRFDAGPADARPAARTGAGAAGVGTARDAYKRSFDLAVLLAAAALLAPLWVPLALVLPLAIRARDGGPALYRQRRLGRGGTVFEILKFRTMVLGAEGATGPVWAAPRDARATPLGRVLRRLRLDELPQALNVLRGEMSLVGPRPERPELAPGANARRRGSRGASRRGRGSRDSPRRAAARRSGRATSSATTCSTCAAWVRGSTSSSARPRCRARRGAGRSRPRPVTSATTTGARRRPA